MGAEMPGYAIDLSGFKALARLSQLTSLTLGELQLNDENMNSCDVAAVLAELTQLKFLQLCSKTPDWDFFCLDEVQLGWKDLKQLTQQ